MSIVDSVDLTNLKLHLERYTCLLCHKRKRYSAKSGDLALWENCERAGNIPSTEEYLKKAEAAAEARFSEISQAQGQDFDVSTSDFKVPHLRDVFSKVLPLYELDVEKMLEKRIEQLNSQVCFEEKIKAALSRRTIIAFQSQSQGDTGVSSQGLDVALDTDSVPTVLHDCFGRSIAIFGLKSGNSKKSGSAS